MAMARAGKATTPWQAPLTAPAMAAIVSVSPPSEAARQHARHGSSGMTLSTAKAAGTDS